jgi:hypothetical protein
MHRQITVMLCMVVVLALAWGQPTAAQSGSDLIELEVDVAFDGNFRDEQWFPIQVTVTNNGDPIDGRVIVRPETSRGVRGSFSVPVDLPTSSRKTDTLYVVAQGITTQVRVELIDNVDELVLASETVGLRVLQPSDQLYVVVTNAAAGSIDLTGARADGMGAVQSNWEVDTIPDSPVALSSINMMVFSDVDTGGMTLDQEAAIEAWVANGGNLVVTGGINWQATSAGLLTMLPFEPTEDTTIDDITPLAVFANSADELTGDTTLTTGNLREDTRVLVATEAGEPLVIRRDLGEGTVHYVTVDPNTTPLRGWGDLPDLWYTLATISQPIPAWSRNFGLWDNTNAAAQILPGIDVLPSVLPICGFLALYIALIGPLNYLVLNRINRREWAWLTIPVLIVLFSVLAFIVGGQLRGTTANIGRIAIVRSWQDTEIAHSTEIIGLLSPQRTQYTMDAADGMLVRSLPRPTLTGTAGGGSLLASTFQTSIEFRQTENFSAYEFPVDASFIAGFASYGTVERPDITGTATIFYPTSERNIQVARGSVRNGTDFTLTDGVILARGATFRLTDPLEPGEVATFELRMDSFQSPAPAPIGYPLGQANLGVGYGGIVLDQSARDILGENNFAYNAGYNDFIDGDNTVERQEQRRRQLFLTALMREQYQSTARGNDVYFVGWHTDTVSPLELEDRDYTAYPTTLFVVDLEVEVEQPVDKRVRVGPDQFVWSVYERQGIGSDAPINFSVGEGNSIAFRYTPLPDAQLDNVEELWIQLQRNTSGNVSIPVDVWNWDDLDWDAHSVSNDRLEISDPEPYIGPENSVIVRIEGNDISFMTLRYLRVEHVGTFDGEA